MRIRVDDLQGPENCETSSDSPSRTPGSGRPPESIHALDLNALRSPEITFWTAWDGAALLGCGALKELDPSHGEDKVDAHRGRTSAVAEVAARLLAHGRR